MGRQDAERFDEGDHEDEGGNGGQNVQHLVGARVDVQEGQEGENRRAGTNGDRSRDGPRTRDRRLEPALAPFALRGDALADHHRIVDDGLAAFGSQAGGIRQPFRDAKPCAMQPKGALRWN